VTIEIAGADDGTEVELAHSGFSTEAVRDDHIVGWSDCLARLPAWLAEC
jgi:Activator of Hsp90 ATPase homolog 1-like protein